MISGQSPSTQAVSLLRQAHTLLAGGRRREALQIAHCLAEQPSASAAWLDSLGSLFTYCEEPARAVTYFQRAVAAAPTQPGYLYNLATAQRMLGAFADAEATLDRVIALNPRDLHAYHTRADLRTQTPDHNHVAELMRLLDAGDLPLGDRILGRFALGKELEDLREFDRAFAHFSQGCALERARTRYDVASDVATLGEIARCFDGPALASAAGVDSRECIFVSGLPRSGTTLLERILARHSQLRSIGESPAFPVALMAEAQRRLGRTLPKFELVARSLELDPEALGRLYLETARPQPEHRVRFIDKQPLNYLYLGLIRRSLPHAKLIVMSRDPMDVCFALFKTLFSGAYLFSYSQDDLAHYYTAWQQLIRHWKTALGEQLLIVRYEDLVRAPELTIRRVLEHCDLPWEAQCLSFYDEPTPVSSASAVQVRRPLYTTSVGKWHCYESHLEVLRERLRELDPPAFPAPGQQHP